MARTAVAVTELPGNSAVADPAGAALDPTNGHVVSGIPLEELVLEIEVTTVGGGDITIVAGDKPPALEAGQGNLLTPFVQNDVKRIGPFSSGRFVQGAPDAGSLFIDVEAATTGTIKALHVAREV